MVEIIYKNKNYVVINKPAGVPSQPDPSQDDDALSLTSRALASLGERDSVFLVHRLDRTVGGLTVIAREQSYAALLSEAVKNRELNKEYLAVVDGVCTDGTFEDYLCKDSRCGKAFAVGADRKGAKYARLTYRAIASKETDRGAKTLVAVTLDTGRYHQIRAQFASRSLPLCGDGKYGSKDKFGKNIALFAFRLTLPTDGRSYTAMPELSEYPWCIFEKVLYERL